MRIVDLARTTHTDTLGVFQFPRVSGRVVDLSFRRLGYGVEVARIDMLRGEGDSVRVRLTPMPIRLKEMSVEAPESANPFFVDFERRRSVGLGTYITEEQIRALNTDIVSDAFRRLPGVRLVPVNGGLGIRFPATTSLRRGGDCVPMIWVDGQRAPGMEIDEIRAGDVHGIEIYKGTATTPPQFTTSGAVPCGVIVVWTRRKR